MTGSEKYLAALASHAGIDVREIRPPAHRHAQVNGLRLRYLDWGDASAPALLLLHGGGQSAHTWDAFCLAIGDRYRCVALDQRGHGDSEWSPHGEYEIVDHARDIAAFVKTLALRGSVVVGMSMGGVNAIRFAADHADRLRALICVDIGPEAQFEPVDRLMQGLGDYRVFASPDDAARQLARQGARRELSLLRDTLSLNLRQRDDGSWTWKYDPRTLVGVTARQILDARRPLWDALHRIVCPSLVIRGADSEIFSAEDAERFARALPHGRWTTVARARHSVQTDNPRGLATVVRDFIDRLTDH
jgi:pimeloyl-ACP methyl ester carboxylesterase